MRKAASICCIALGTALLLAALFLVLHNTAEDRKSGETAERLLDALRQEIPEYTGPSETALTGESGDLFPEFETETEAAAPETITLDGNVYLGYLSIPELGLELPVLRDWSYPNLKLAPCRYQGSAAEDDLILCAHNYDSHFGRLRELHTDSEIIFTDVTGVPHRYSVLNTEELPGTAVEQMQFGDAAEWDLTLFTCTRSGQSRVTVRAARTEE